MNEGCELSLTNFPQYGKINLLIRNTGYLLNVITQARSMIEKCDDSVIDISMEAGPNHALEFKKIEFRNSLCSLIRDYCESLEYKDELEFVREEIGDIVEDYKALKKNRFVGRKRTRSSRRDRDTN